MLGSDGGTLTSDGVTYVVHADGSGTVISGSTAVTVDVDGSGTYVDEGGAFTVDANGSGSYTGAYSYSVEKDGSGTYVGDLGSYTLNPDGSGEWVGERGPVEVDAAGHASILGVPVSAPPMPRLVPFGRFPKLPQLLPLGKPCGLLIRISARTLFDFDSATLRTEAAPVLRSVAAALRSARGKVSVNGHTDSVGSDAYNLGLSQSRAQAVLDALTSDGVTAPMTPHGFGETQPVAPNTLHGKDNPAGRQLNRRVEIVVAP